MFNLLWPYLDAVMMDSFMYDLSQKGTVLVCTPISKCMKPDLVIKES